MNKKSGVMGLCFILFFVVLGLSRLAIAAEVIVDNGGPGTSFEGGWPDSGGTPYYGSRSVYSKFSSSDTYTYQATVSDYELQEVSMWWTEWASRCTDVLVDISDGVYPLETVTINQQDDGGKWNILGSYVFTTGTAKVVINAQGGCSTNADAVKFIDSGGGGECTLDSKFVYGVANNGAKYYTDRDYTITDAGPFAGMTMIKTPNADRNSTMSNDYLKYEVMENGYLYVGYDKRATTPPNWLTNNFTKIDCKIYTSLSSQGWLDVYTRAVGQGECVDLGANKGPGFSGGTASNYIVLESATNVGDQCGGGGCTLDSKFVPGLANNGDTYYADRTYTITDAGAFSGMYMIKTPDNDRDNTTASDYLKYLPAGDGYLYVGYDKRATTPPNWLTSTFTQIPCAKISTSLSSQGWLDVYKREVSLGECVNLGGNKGPGFSGGTVSNFIVLYSTTNVGDQCPPPAATNPLPKTGQTSSYNENDDGNLQRGTDWPSPRFTNNGGGTIRDNMTGLIWTADADLNEGGIYWTTALSFCNSLSEGNSALTDGSVAGDWALPNRNELLSLIDSGEYNPALPTGYASYFTNVKQAYYWSATTLVVTTSDAWGVSLFNGDVVGSIKNNYSYYVWCVRGGP